MFIGIEKEMGVKYDRVSRWLNFRYYLFLDDVTLWASSMEELEEELAILENWQPWLPKMRVRRRGDWIRFLGRTIRLR